MSLLSFLFFFRDSLFKLFQNASHSPSFKGVIASHEFVICTLTFWPAVQNSKFRKCFRFKSRLCTPRLSKLLGPGKRRTVTCILFELSCFAALLGSTVAYVLLWHYGAIPCNRKGGGAALNTLNFKKKMSTRC